MQTSDPVLLKKHGTIAVVTLNRPERKNAIDETTHHMLRNTLKAVRRDEELRAVILTGVGDSFCAGGDLKAAAKEGANLIPLQRMKRVKNITGALIMLLYEFPIPTIAAVNGSAMGMGLNIALACDIRIASEKAKFGAVFVKRGLHPDAGGTYYIPRLAGTQKAYELLLTGDMFSAEDALKYKLVNRVVPHGKLMEETMSMAQKISENAPVPIRMMKQILRRCLDSSLDEILLHEVPAQALCITSDDAREGFSAFLEKRKPEFKGK